MTSSLFTTQPLLIGWSLVAGKPFLGRYTTDYYCSEIGNFWNNKNNNNNDGKYSTQ